MAWVDTLILIHRQGSSWTLATTCWQEELQTGSRISAGPEQCAEIITFMILLSRSAGAGGGIFQTSLTIPGRPLTLIPLAHPD